MFMSSCVMIVSEFSNRIEAIFSYQTPIEVCSYCSKNNNNKKKLKNKKYWLLLNKQQISLATSEPENPKILSNSELQVKNSVAYNKKSVYYKWTSCFLLPAVSVAFYISFPLLI